MFKKINSFVMGIKLLETAKDWRDIDNIVFTYQVEDWQ